MSIFVHDCWQRLRLMVDQGLACALEPGHGSVVGKRSNLSQLEPRILFSATPIDPGVMMGDADMPEMVVEIGESEQATESTLFDSSIQQTQTVREIVVIDSNVPDLQQFLDDLHDSGRDSAVYVLEGDQDGVDQITAILESHQEVDSLHIVSHAENGAVRLGNSWLSDANLDAYAGQIAAWQGSLAVNADILIYGCDLAASADGIALVDGIGALSGADVAASNDDTGHADYNSDWDLEYSVGTIESQVAFSTNLQNDWVNKLATITVTTFNDVIDSGDGLISLREAVVQANSNGDTIDLSTIGAGTFTLSIAGTNEDSAATGDLDITGNVTIIGLDAASTIIDGDGIDRVFDLQGGSANLTMSDVTVQGGSISDRGGGIQVDNGGGVLTLDRVIIQNNFGDDGAGIFNQGTINLTDVVIANNGNEITTSEGGGLHNKSNATLNRVTLSGNKADLGGGIHHDNTANSLSLTNVTVSGNTAASAGGGLYSQNDATIVNSTFTLNVTDSGGGIRVQSGTTSITNTIVANNTAFSANSDVQGNFDSQGFNLIQVVGSASGFIGSDLTSVGALLDPLSDNGGFGQTHALQTGSLAINAGTTTGAPAVDQRGVSRVASPDIGAYEIAASLLAYEAFDYSAGSLEGQNGGTGWATAWTRTAGSSAVVNATGLTDPTSTLPVQGGTAEMSTSGQFTQVRDLNTTLGTDGTTAWFSFLIQPDGIGAGGMSLVIGDGAGAKDLITVGTSSNDFLITKNASASGASQISNTLVDGQTYFLTVQIDFAAGNDTVTLYVDSTPGQSSPDAVQTTQLTSADLGTFTEIGMIGGFSGNNTLFDEIRVGASFADVAPAIANAAPTVANPIADQTATQDVAFNLQFASNVFDDGDGDTLTFTATLDDTSALPTWLTFNDTTRTFSGTPTNDNVGSVTIRVTADDGQGGTVFDDFVLTVDNVNDDPTVDNAIADQTATQDTPFSFQFASNTFGDIDGDTLTYTATQNDSSALPTWLVFNEATRTFSGTPTDNDVETITVRVTANDTSSGSAFDDFVLTVADVNDAPTVSLTSLVSHLDENADTTSAIVVATISVTDDAIGSANLSLSGDDVASFEIVGSNLRLRAGTTFDFETNPLLDVTVEVDDPTISGTPEDSAAFSLTINDVTEAFTNTSEFRVNTTPGDEQNTIASGRGSKHAVSTAGDGSYVVAWSSLNQDGSGQGVYARRFDSTGTPITGEVLVNETTTADQLWASVASAADGTFVVTWTDFDGTSEGVKFRRFAANGTAITSETLVNTTTAGAQGNSSIAMNRMTGEFIIVWQGNGSQASEADNNGIFAQRFDRLGAAVGDEFRVNSATAGGQFDGAVSMNDSGDFVVTWDDGSGFHFQVFDDSGVEQGGQITVDSSSLAGNGSVAMHSDGSFVVVWREGAVGAQDTFIQRFENNGTPASGIQAVATSTANNQTDPSIAMDSTGAFVVVWEGNGTQVGQADSDGVFGRKFDAAATAISSEFRINDTTVGIQGRVSAAMLDADNFVVVWSGNGDQAGETDTSGVFAQQFGNASGNAAPTVVNSIPDQTAAQDSPISFSFASNTFNDADGDALSFTAAIAGGSSLPTWLAFDAGTRTFSGTPSNGDVGAVTIRVTADDGNLNTVSDDFVLTVNNVNDDPTVDNTIADQTATQGTAFNFQFAVNTFGDIDGDTLSYTATLNDISALPTWLTFDDSTRTFSGTPGNSDVGAITIRVTSNDGDGGTVSDDFVLAVNNVNDDPTVENPIADQVATQDSAFSFQFAANTFSDIDGDTLTYTATLNDTSPLPTWLTFDDATRTFSGTPTNADVGAITIRVIANDGTAGAVSDDFELTVGDANDRPTDITLDNTSVDENAAGAVIGNVGVTDPNVGDTHVLAVSDSRFEIVGTQLKLKVDQSLDREADQTVSLTITATDQAGAGLDYSETLVITVANVNEAPVSVGDSYRVRNGETLVAASVLANDVDPESDLMTVTEVVSTANGRLTLNADGTFTYTPNDGFSGTDVFVYTASDGSLTGVSTTVTIEVAALITAVMPEAGRNAAVVETTEEVVEEDAREESETIELVVDAIPDGAQDTKVVNDRTTARALIDAIAPTETEATATEKKDGGAMLVDTLMKENESKNAESDRNDGVGGSVTDVLRSAINRTTTAISSVDRALMVAPGLMWNELDQQMEFVESQIKGDLIVVGAAGAAASSFTVGLVSIALRTGFLASGFLAQMPAWKSLDPLLVMQGLGETGDEESLQEVMNRRIETLDNEEQNAQDA